MLVIKVSMLEGRTDEQKALLIRRLSEAAARHFGVPLDEVRLLIYDLPKVNWGAGGVTMAAREKAPEKG